MDLIAFFEQKNSQQNIILVLRCHFFCRLAGAIISATVLMQIYILFRGMEATWAFFNFMFVSTTLISAALFYGFEIDKLGLTDKFSREGYISTALLALFWAILCFGLADQIYI